MSKHHVGMGYSLCPVCMKENVSVVLMQKALGAPPKLDEKNFMGWEMCNEHEAMTAEYVALVETVGPATGTHATLNDVHRTGSFAHVRREVLPHILVCEPPPPDTYLVFVEEGVIDALAKMQKEQGDEMG